jgi:hypothetical protein
MGRIRTIKPDTFKDDDLAEQSFECRLLFIGLWTQADVAGRLEDRPKRLKVELFPYDEDLDVNAMLEKLHEAGFIIRYSMDEKKYIQVVNFTKHQRINGKEAQVPSQIPPPIIVKHRGSTSEALETNREAPETTGREGKGKEGKGTEALLEEVSFDASQVKLETFSGEQWFKRIAGSWPLEDFSHAAQVAVFEAIEEEAAERRWPRAEAASFMAEKVAAISAVIKREYPMAEWKYFPFLKHVQQRAFRRDLETFKNPKNQAGTAKQRAVANAINEAFS